MYKIRNNEKFLIVVNLKQGRSKHLLAFESCNIDDNQYDSPDLQTKIKRKLISVIEKPNIKVIQKPAKINKKLESKEV